MKRLLLANAMIFAAWSSFAQSSVTIYGILDAGVLDAKGSRGDSVQLVAGNLYPSRIGFKGAEDIGGGLAMTFVLEAGINNDTGTGVASNTNNQPSGATTGNGLQFNRQSWLGLKGNFGEVRLGRDYTPTYWTAVKYDVAYTSGSAASETTLRSASYQLPGGARSSNAMVYITPKMNGFSIDSMYALGENLRNSGPTRNDGNFAGARLTYASGPLDASIAYGRFSIEAVGGLREIIAGASYDLNVVKVEGFYTRDDTRTGSDMHGYTVGLSAPVGASRINASYSTSHVENAAGVTTGDSKKIAFQGIYSLSKRTQLYAIWARVANSNGASSTTFFGQGSTAPNHPLSATSFGMIHYF